METKHKCDCGHVVGAPVTLRIHQNTHVKGEGTVVKAIKKAVKRVTKK